MTSLSRGMCSTAALHLLPYRETKLYWSLSKVALQSLGNWQKLFGLNVGTKQTPRCTHSNWRHWVLLDNCQVFVLFATARVCVVIEEKNYLISIEPLPRRKTGLLINKIFWVPHKQTNIDTNKLLNGSPFFSPYCAYIKLFCPPSSTARNTIFCLIVGSYQRNSKIPGLVNVLTGSPRWIKH